MAGPARSGGYTVAARGTLAEAARLLDQETFDLVVTDGLSMRPRAAFITTGDLVRSAGSTPVTLFSAHTHDPGVARAAGFRDLITKPFDVDTLVRQVKMLLGGLPGYAAPDPSSGGAPWPPVTESAYADPARAPRERSFEVAGG